MNHSWIEYKDNALSAESRGDFDTAEQNWIHAISILRAQANDERSLSSALERLSAVYIHKKMAAQAIPVLTESMNIKLRALGPDHALVGQVQNDLARAYFLVGSLDKAAHYALNCLTCFEVAYGPDTEEVATTALNLATTYQLAGRLGDAEPHYKKSLAIRTKRLGGNNPLTVKVLQNYAKLLREMHRHAEADHLDSCVTGVITGSWKALVIADKDSLVPDNSCNFCGQKLSAGAKKCSKCGTPAGSAI